MVRDGGIVVHANTRRYLLFTYTCCGLLGNVGYASPSCGRPGVFVVLFIATFCRNEYAEPNSYHLTNTLEDALAAVDVESYEPSW